MKYNWNKEKNKILKETRHISFEEIVEYLENGFLAKDEEHPLKEKYPNQRIYCINIDNYIYVVPYIPEGKDSIFLKTIYPSRRKTKELLNK